MTRRNLTDRLRLHIHLHIIACVRDTSEERRKVENVLVEDDLCVHLYTNTCSGKLVGHAPHNDSPKGIGWMDGWMDRKVDNIGWRKLIVDSGQSIVDEGMDKQTDELTITSFNTLILNLFTTSLSSYSHPTGTSPAALTFPSYLYPNLHHLLLSNLQSPISYLLSSSTASQELCSSLPSPFLTMYTNPSYIVQPTIQVRQNEQLKMSEPATRNNVIDREGLYGSYTGAKRVLKCVKAAWERQAQVERSSSSMTMGRILRVRRGRG